MIPMLIGKSIESGDRIYLQRDEFRRHTHLVGATGTGKTTAIHAMLRPLMMDCTDKSAIFIIDPMGNLSRDLLLFIADKRLCPQHVRERLLYIEPSREDVVLPFNPLLHTSEGNRYFNTMRAMDIVLRAWSAQDLTSQPRLMQWTYKAFMSAATMGLPISMCRFLLHPGTVEHTAILQRIPAEIQSQWSEILNARGSEATRILESTRNRLDPFFESNCLRQMFGNRRSNFDCERFVLDRRIVIVNVAEMGRLPEFIGNTIGALVLNEIVQTCTRLATTMGREAVDPTYILMDEFQRFVGLDIENAIPTVRQMGLRLILAHQSFSQLERDDVDLTQMIWQAQQRLVFSNNARDADIVADEIAKLMFNSRVVKSEIHNTKQLVKGFRRELLNNYSSTDNNGQTWGDSNVVGFGENSSQSNSHDEKRKPTDSMGKSKQNSTTNSSGRSSGQSSSKGASEVNVPIHERFQELSSRTFETFEEYSLAWGKYIRRLKTGEAVLMRPNRENIEKVKIDFVPIEPTPERIDAVEELLAANFRDPCFITAHAAQQEAEALRCELLGGRIDVGDQPPSDTSGDPFR